MTEAAEYQAKSKAVPPEAGPGYTKMTTRAIATRRALHGQLPLGVQCPECSIASTGHFICRVGGLQPPKERTEKYK
jgi:hypothetical protein